MSRRLGLLVPVLIAGAAAAAAASAALAGGGTPLTPHAKNAWGETVIPFASSIGSIEWQPVSDDTLYLRGGRGEWYLVTTMNRCSRLRQAAGIGLQTRAGQLDRHGAIMVEGVRCPVESITRSDQPPPRRKARRKG